MHPKFAIEVSDNEAQNLVNKMLAGDKLAFDQLFRQYYTPLVRFCFRFVADIDIASEIVQDLFVKLWTNRESLKISGDFKSYMMKSVHNATITYINKERAHAETNLRVFGSEGEAADPSEELQGNHLEAAYRRIIDAMPEKRREVFTLSRFDGLKYSEIAERLQISLKTVEAHMSAAIKQLKEGLKDYL